MQILEVYSNYIFSLPYQILNLSILDSGVLLSSKYVGISNYSKLSGEMVHAEDSSYRVVHHCFEVSIYNTHEKNLRLAVVA